MKLSEIVAYLNLLDELDVHDEASEATRRLLAVKHVVDNHAIQFANITNGVDRCVSQIKNGLDEFENSLDDLREHLERKVAQLEPEYLARSLQHFEQESVYETPEYILSRQLRIDSDSDVKLRYRLKNLTDWRLPGLIFRPAAETHVEDFVPLDPLYIVDQHQTLIDAATKKFTVEYQRRLRTYVVDNYSPKTILHALPDNQFGLVFAYNYFNFLPMEIIKKYLDELVAKIRPGGTLIMTYNNCDRAHGVGLAERSWMMYTPKRLVVAAAEAAGFDLTYAHDGAGDVSWLEFTRPGQIETIRGGQTLAKIIAIE